MTRPTTGAASPFFTQASEPPLITLPPLLPPPHDPTHFPPWMIRTLQTILTPSNFIYPIFVHDGEEDIPINSMPG
jgi:porphobilinogen synthase